MNRESIDGVRAESMSERVSQSKLPQVDRLIAKAKQNLKPVTTQVQRTTMQTNKREQSELEKKAREEILKDAALGVRRYEKIGPQGWCVLLKIYYVRLYNEALKYLFKS